MPLTEEDNRVFEELAQVGRLYERYLEVSQVNEFVLAEAEQGDRELPAPPAPLGLVIRTGH